MKNHVFKSDNILLCSFLLCNEDIRLIDIIEDHPHHFIFVLSDSEKCNKLKNDFVNGGLAPAQLLFSKRETLISEIKTRN